MSVCVDVYVINCIFSRPSLALRTYDQFQVSHWSSSPPTILRTPSPPPRGWNINLLMQEVFFKKGRFYKISLFQNLLFTSKLRSKMFFKKWFTHVSLACLWEYIHLRFWYFLPKITLGKAWLNRTKFERRKKLPISRLFLQVFSYV